MSRRRLTPTEKLQKLEEEVAGIKRVLIGNNSASDITTETFINDLNLHQRTQADISRRHDDNTRAEVDHLFHGVFDGGFRNSKKTRRKKYKKNKKTKKYTSRMTRKRKK